MDYRPLGRTGAHVSVVSLGSGGARRLGQDRGATSGEMVRLVRTAHEAGINLFDTSPAYGNSEEVLGEALRGLDRSTYLLATKVPVDGSAADVDGSVTRSLRRFGTDHIDLLQLHGVRTERYRHAVDCLLPVLEARRDRGDVRFIGITEVPRLDPTHTMLAIALEEGRFDTVMVGYNLLCPTAERNVFPRAADTGTGVIAMVAVRRTLADPALLARRLADATERGVIDPDGLPDWLLRPTGAAEVAAAAYKFAAGHPAVATVLTGTGDIDHLADNVAAVLGRPLPAADVDRIRAVFGGVEETLFE